MMTVRYPIVLFDLDHTLFDSDAAEVLSFGDALRAGGVCDPDPHFSEYVRINTALWAAVERGETTPTIVKTRRFELLGESQGIPLDATVAAEAFAHGLGANGDLYPGARRLLDDLAGVARLALVTNGLTAVQNARLDRLDIGRYFEHVVISSEVGVSKPAPAIFALTHERLGSPPIESMLMVGDSLTSDIAGANAFRIASCWFNRHGSPRSSDAHVDHEVRDLAEIVAVVHGLSG